MNAKEIFSERLIKLREEKGLMRQKAADELGISRASLEYYEKGKRVPDIETLYNIAKHFGVSTDYLLGRTDNKTLDTELQAVCEYTGLNEEAIKSLKKAFAGDPLGCLSKCENQEYRKKCFKVLNWLLSAGYIEKIIDKLLLLRLDSKYYIDDLKKTVEPNDADKWGISINMDLVLEKDYQLNLEADVIRYQLTKIIEEISDYFDMRKD